MWLSLHRAMPSNQLLLQLQLVLLLVVSCSVTGRRSSVFVGTISPACERYLQGVATSNSDFEVCALLNARPFTVCSFCYESYATAHNIFVQLKNGRGPVEKNCSDDLVSGDRVSIINRAYNYLTDTWTLGNCDHCLVIEKKDDEISFRLSDWTVLFLSKHRDVQLCIDQHLQNKSGVCSECQPYFRNLTDFYNTLMTRFKGELCMDIIDAMNETRVEWSEYGCSHVYTLTAEVYVYAGIMVALTIAFYVAARFYQKPMDAELIEGRTMKHHMSKLLIVSASINSARGNDLLLPTADQNTQVT